MEINPLLYGQLREQNLSLGINDPEEVCGFLFAFLQAYPKYATGEELLEQMANHLSGNVTI